MRTIQKRVVRTKKENFIVKFFKNFRQKEETKVRKELNFLFQQVFQYYYDAQKPHKISGVDIPEFMYDKQRFEIAERRAFKALLYRVADKNVVSRLCTKRLNQLKKQGNEITL